MQALIQTLVTAAAVFVSLLVFYLLDHMKTTGDCLTAPRLASHRQAAAPVDKAHWGGGYLLSLIWQRLPALPATATTISAHRCQSSDSRSPLSRCLRPPLSALFCRAAEQ